MSPKRLAVASFLAASIAAVLMAFAPTVQLEQSSNDTGGGASSVTTSSTNLVSSEGAGVLLILAVPVAIALLPVLVTQRWARIASALLLWVLCVLGLASVGLFFVPAAALMTVAASRRDPAVVPTPG